LYLRQQQNPEITAMIERKLPKLALYQAELRPEWGRR
jgi:hypothetical protein